jgi:CIC family chloride channel protein
VRLDQLVSTDFTIARDEDIMFRVIGRMWRRKATMAVVVSGGRIPRTSNVVGIITKEHVADSVAESIRPYAAADALL